MFAKRLFTRLVFTTLILASLFFTSLGITPAYAAGIVVNTNKDEIHKNGRCSLREAIINANNDAATYQDCTGGIGKDTITFAGNYTITLAGAQLPAVTSEMIIKGNGAAKTIIQANASRDTATYRVFSVTGSNGNLTLDGVTVRHGRCTGSCELNNTSGGGIYAGEDTILTITNSTISGNSAKQNGGGILTYQVTLTVTSSTFSGNSANQIGGGIFNHQGNLTLTDSSFSGNSATNGGGITITYGTWTVTNSTFSGNSASSRGGGIYTDKGNLTLTASSFSGNNAKNGGGLFTGLVTVAITGSTFSGNSASESGGGIFREDNGPLNLTNSTISRNNAGSNGGGIYNSSLSDLGIYTSTVSGNNAGTGGGIYNGGNMWLGNATISGNEAYDYGGGIYSDGGAWIHNSTIAFNVLVEGTNLGAGGIDGNVALYNSLVAGNTRALTSEYRDCSGTMHLQGVNAFWNMTNCSIDPASPGYTTFLFSLNELGPLQDNGGPTWTHALLPIEEGSRAIDTGDNTLCASWPINNLDQRALARPQGTWCDIGAYEAVPTFFSVSAQDGWILETSETSGNGGSKNDTNSVIHLGDNASNKQFRSILSFDTSTIPEGAIIHTVTLKVKKAAVKGGGNPVNIFKGFMIDVKTGEFGVAALESGDFKAAGDLTLGPLKPPLVNGWYSLDLTAANLQINTTGNTQIRLRFKLDDNNNLVVNYLTLYSGNAVFTNQPQLLVEYTVP